MADRSLRGMRLGSQSLQSEERVEFSPRKRAVFQTADGSTFEVVFAAEAEVPESWQSPKSGQEGTLLSEDGKPVEIDRGDVKTPRTH